MSLASSITPNFAVMKAWQNWALVAVVILLTGVVFHLVATAQGATSTASTQTES